ncbi:MAG: hypothetical protein ABEJ65_11675 [bacterium]
MRAKIRTIIRVICVLMLGVIITGCGSSNVEKEPNNSIDKAQKLPLKTSFKTKIQEKKDIDWFKVKAPGQGYLRLKAENIPEKIGFVARFALKKEWKGSKLKPLTDWNKTPLSIRVPEKGTYYIQVGDDYDDAKSDQAISIEAEFLEEFDSHEINDSPKQAVSVEKGNVVKPAIYPTGDRDWFKMKVKKKGYLIAKESDVPEGINPQVRWVKYDEWSTPKTRELRGWHDIPGAVFVPQKGEYYVELQDDYNDGQSTKNFKIKLESIKSMDPGEPNNSVEEASELKPGETVKAAIFPHKDQDYFRISGKKSGQFRLRTSGVEGVTPQMRLLVKNNDGSTSKVTGWTKPPAKFSVKSDSQYILHLIDDYNDQRSPKPFKLITQWKKISK